MIRVLPLLQQILVRSAKKQLQELHAECLGLALSCYCWWLASTEQHRHRKIVAKSIILHEAGMPVIVASFNAKEWDGPPAPLRTI